MAVKNRVMLLRAAMLGCLAGQAAAASECRDMLLLPADMVGFTGIASAAASAYREAGTNLTWDSANAACIKEGSKLCTSAQMCSGGKPTVAAPRPSAAWAPVGDAANVWVDVGSDANACKKFEEVNGFKPEWGNDASQKKDYRGLYRCCNADGGGMALPAPAMDASVEPPPIQKQFPCECNLLPDTLTAEQKQGLAEAADAEAFLTEINPEVHCVCMDKLKGLPLCMADPKVVAKEMKDALWDPETANIGPSTDMPKFNDPNVASSEGLTPAPPKGPEKSRVVLTIEEEMSLTSGLTDLLKTMDESRAARVAASKRIAVLQAQIKKQEDTSIPIETLLRKPAVQVDTAKTVQVTKKRVTEEPLAAKPKIAVKKIATAEVADAHSNLNEFKSAMEDFAADIQAAKTE